MCEQVLGTGVSVVSLMTHDKSKISQKLEMTTRYKFYIENQKCLLLPGNCSKYLKCHHTTYMKPTSRSPSAYTDKESYFSLNNSSVSDTVQDLPHDLFSEVAITSMKVLLSKRKGF